MRHSVDEMYKVCRKPPGEFTSPPQALSVLSFSHTSTMRFSMTLTFVAAVLTPLGVRGGITAFSGNSCDGAVGDNVPCDGSCHQFDERHSFRVRIFPPPESRASLEDDFTDGDHVQVDGGTGTHCVTVFVDPGCPRDAMGFEQSFFKSQTGQCTNVNTGTNARSFLCAPDSTCLLGAA